MGIFGHSSRSTLVRSHTDVGQESRSNSSQMCSIRLRSGLCAGQSSSSTSNSLLHVFMDLALCTGAQSCWNRKGPSPNCSHKVGSMELSNISWYAEGFRVPYTGTEGPSPAPEKQPHTIIRPPPNFTLGSQTVTVLLATAKPRLVHQIVRWRSEIYHSRERVSTALESSGGTLTPLHPTLCIALADVRLGCSCLAMETHSMKLSTRCS